MHSAFLQKARAGRTRDERVTTQAYCRYLLVFMDEINIIVLVRNEDKVFLPLNLIFIYIHTCPQSTLVSIIKKEHV